MTSRDDGESGETGVDDGVVGSTVDGSDRERSTEPPFADGGAPGFDEERLHAVVRDAVEDAILGAVGTLLLVGIGFLFFASGLSALFRTTDPVGDAFSVGLLLVGLGLVVWTLRDALPAGRWL